MKISKIFHWLYFTVMMLPCVIIPIFAIFTRNENYNSNIELNIEQNQVVDFNQKVRNGNFETTQNWVVASDTTLTVQNNIAHIDFTGSVYNNPILAQTVSIPQNHKYLIKFNVRNATQIALNYGGYNNWLQYNLDPNAFTTIEKIITKGGTGNYLQLFVNKSLYSSNYYFEIEGLNFFDLTQMYGEGNEPTISDFDNVFDENYYPTTQSKVMLIDSTITRTYNDTDVGSQFVYTLYNATDKYFNFDNFFGLDNVYSWIQLNWFSGNAPLGFAIFWHFFTYWLLASLAWLLFDLMVYVPLYIHRWLDKGAIE